MLIIGISDRHKTVKEGKFSCPSCQHTRAFKLKAARMYFSLFFIPLIPLKELGEYIECQHCRRHFEPNVLTNLPPTPIDLRAPAVRQDARSGTPLEMVHQKIINEGYAADFADDLLRAAVGPARAYCQNCSLTYASSVQKCANCGRNVFPT